MSKEFNLSNTTISKYLKIGNELNWYKYAGTWNTSHYNNFCSNDARKNSKPILCLTNNIYFKSIGLCSKYSKEIFGKHLGDSSIRFRVNNNNPKSRKNNFNFQYITKEQFNKAISDNLTCYGTPFT